MGRTYVEHSVDGAAVLAEGRRSNEERGHEVHRVGASELASKLGCPTLGRVALTESAGIASEGGSEDTAVVLELVWVVRVRRDERTKRSGVCGSRAREGAVGQSNERKP